MKKAEFNINKTKKEELSEKLMISFLDEMKDESFKEFVSKIPLSYEILSKYTTLLKKSQLEYSECQKCKSITQCQKQINGYAYLPKIDENKLSFSYQRCKFQKKVDDDFRYLNNIYTIDTPNFLKNARMKNIYKEDKNRFETIKWLNNFIKSYLKDKNQKGLYLYGNFGCGKTYLISAALVELARNDIKSAIVFWPEFLSDIKSSFQNDSKVKLSYIKKVPILFLDDIGADYTTQWSRDEILFPILQYRMENKLPTFMTSNLNLKELETHFSISKEGVESLKARRIIERIKQLTEQIEMVSKNLRD